MIIMMYVACALAAQDAQPTEAGSAPTLDPVIYDILRNADEAANVRVFKNDEISAYGDDVEIGIGELVEIYPDFPETEA